MPASRARASFEPIPPDFDVDALVESNQHFHYVDRISCDMIDQQGMEAFDKLVLAHVVKKGRPLVIEGYQARLDEWTFSLKWLHDNHGEKVENARNLTKKEAMPLTIGHYLRNMGKLSDQYFENPENYLDKNRQRIYLKDIDCPSVWADKLREKLPPNLFYLNESTGEIGGPGADEEFTRGVGRRQGRGIAPAGDLMSSLLPAMRAENLMCYIGHEGTYTPCHREMCASLGHNIMVETSGLVGADGKPEKPGSSIWFMTESSDRETVSEYWLSVLGHDIEVENHFAQIAAWKKAPFDVYIVEQRVGDFLLIPPLAPHQVWNRGTRTMKVAWNRTTVETLEMAMNEALPRARQVCRDEQYKNKAIIFSTLNKYHGLLSKARDSIRTAPSPQEQAKLSKSPKIRALRRDFKKLFHLFENIMLSEMFAPETPTERNVQFLPFDSNVTCSYCRGNIFNRFLTCQNCDTLLETPEAEPYDICMECYVMGRSCGCISKLRWVEQFKWKELVQKFENWRRLYIDLELTGANEDQPLPLPERREKLDKNTLAQICQYQLKKRPFVDVKKPQQPEEESSESEDNGRIEIGEDGTVKKKRKKRSEAWLKNHRACHVCCHRHERWKMAECSCGRNWCYGTLFRGHDLMPQQVMEKPNWRCPHCEGVCSAGNCRKDPRQRSHEPKGTLLGHDTRAVADVRSVESLVDFSVSNLNWIKEGAEGPDSNMRLRKRQEQANLEKLNDPDIEDEDDDAAAGIEYSPDAEPIDPLLGGAGIPRASVNGANPALSNGIASSSAFSSAGMAQGDHSLSRDPFAGYQPAHQDGFVAPSALMYRQEHHTDESLYMEPEAELLNALGKRPLDKTNDSDVIKATPAKRARYEKNWSGANSKPVSGASKQYRKDTERRTLEEARRAGRYIQVSAALRNKHKIVKLHISPEKLRSVGKEYRQAGDADELLRSDLAPPSAPSAAASITESNRAKGSKASTQKRKNHSEALSDTSSGEEFNEVSRPEGALEETEAGSKRRRISSWQQRRMQENEPPQQTLQPKLTVHFNLPSDGDSSQDDGEENDSTPLHQRTAAAALAQVSRGQPSGVQMNGALDDDEDDDDGIKAVMSSSGKAPAMRSITARASRGKKVKIVSASKRKTVGPGGVSSLKMAATVTPAHFTP